MNVQRAGARVVNLMPRIIAARSRSMGGHAITLYTSLSALSALLIELNQEMNELANLAGEGDPRLRFLAGAIHKIADGLDALLDAVEDHSR